MARWLNATMNGGRATNPSNTQWHHLVEQTANFSARAINSLANIVPTPTHVHRVINGIMSGGQRVHPWLPNGGGRLRDYIAANHPSFQEQFRIGMEIWKAAMRADGQRVSTEVIRKIIGL